MRSTPPAGVSSEIESPENSSDSMVSRPSVPSTVAMSLHARQTHPAGW